MKTLLCAGLLTLSLITTAQEGPKVVVFNSSESKEPEYWSKYNLVKFSVFEAFSGDFAFYYERIFHENLSAEIGFGPTLSNYVSMLWNDDFTAMDDNYEALMGFSFCIGGRYYPYRAADEFYVSPEFKYRYYHNNEYYTDLLGDEQFIEESWQMALGRMTFGYVYFFDENIFIDYSAGFGIGKIKRVDLTQQVNDLGFLETFADESSTLAPRFHIGLKVGVAF